MATSPPRFDLPNFSLDLSRDVAIVTGATAGLGRRFTLALLACGADVAGIGRRADRLEQLAEEVEGAVGRFVAVPADITDDAAMVAAVDAAETALGPVSILVNNAGIPDAQYATKMSTDLVDRVIATNLRAPFLLSCEVARRMMARGQRGRMVNISSMGAFEYGGGAAALYSITKAAVNRMTETLAVEWAKFGINVNGIAPGAFDSEMMEGMIGRIGEIWRGFPRPRLGDPAQLDSTLLYLVSPASEFVTGTVVKVDDGQGSR